MSVDAAESQRGSPPRPPGLLWDAPPNVPRTRCAGGAHPPKVPDMDAERLHWYRSLRIVIRVEAHTCDRCRDVSYEYGLIGGAYRIRRTTRERGRVVVHETPAVRRSVAAEWWQMIMSGQAI